MKKITLVVSIVMALLIGSASLVFAQDQYAPIGEIEGYPDLLEPRIIEGQPANVICWQVVANQTGDRKILRPQIFRANGAGRDGVTVDMANSLKTIKPQVSLNNYPKYWKSYGFTCKPAGWRGFVNYAENVTAPAPPLPLAVAPAPAQATAIALPRVEQPAPAPPPPPLRQETIVESPRSVPAPSAQPEDTQTQLNAIRARMAQIAPPINTKATAVKPKRSTPKPAPSPSPSAACKEQVKKLGSEITASKQEAEKSLKACQGDLETSKRDRDKAIAALEAAKSNLTTEKDGRKSDKLAADKAVANTYALSTVIRFMIFGLILGLLIGVGGYYGYQKIKTKKTTTLKG